MKKCIIFKYIKHFNGDLYKYKNILNLKDIYLSKIMNQKY